MFESVTLACTSEAYPITWNYLQSSNEGFRKEDESSSTINGISTLVVNTDKQGFYSCNIQDNSLIKRYTIGIFDSTTTTGGYLYSGYRKDFLKVIFNFLFSRTIWCYIQLYDWSR